MALSALSGCTIGVVVPGGPEGTGIAADTIAPNVPDEIGNAATYPGPGVPFDGFAGHDTVTGGNGPDVLSKVTMVGSDYRLSDGRWMCGKAGQSVPVGVGIPTVLISGITVGGTRVG